MSAMLQSFDPATGDLVWEGAAATPDTVIRAVAAARQASLDWSATPLCERIAVARTYKSVLEARAEPLARLISRETGKPLWEGRAEVASMVGKVDLSIAAQAERAGETHAAMAFGEAVLRHQPHGTMAVLGPYNFPGHLPNGHIVPALLAGNAVVFKPSELTPAVGEAMADAWCAAGLPDRVFTVVQGAKETGAALADADIDGLLFTGSAATGAHFRRIFADRPKVILALELGGNNPLVVWDGDIAETAALVVQSAYITTGQRCSCARRLILPQGAFGDALIEAIASLRDRLRIGAWDDEPEPYLGPLVSTEAATRAQHQVERLMASGAQPIRRLEHLAGRRETFVVPALIEVTGLAVPDEEIFAPVLQVIRAPDFEGAITAANDTRFGLAAGLVSGDDALWRRFASQVRAGVMNRNRPTTGAAGTMPFGGLNASGNHRPAAWYAADYCAYPVASFEAAKPEGMATALSGMLHP